MDDDYDECGLCGGDADLCSCWVPVKEAPESRSSVDGAVPPSRPMSWVIQPCGKYRTFAPMITEDGRIYCPGHDEFHDLTVKIAAT